MSDKHDFSKGSMNEVGIYVHIPFCVSRCKYCAFVSSTDLSRRSVYVAALLKEIEEKAANAARFSARADTLYLGGGTPSVLGPEQLREIIGSVKKNFRLSDNAEITVECNPDSANEEFFGTIADLGVNRVSVGLQTHDDELLKSVGRPHGRADFVRTLFLADKYGIKNLSSDVMIGLKGQDLKSVTDTLEFVTAFPIVKHVSLYALKVEENTPLYEEAYRPDEDLQADQYEKSADFLESRGFLRYEVSNFAKSGFESRHNMKYWTMKPYIGLGVAAHSFFAGERSCNTSSISAYVTGKREGDARIETADDFKEEYIMLALRTARGIDLADYERRFGEKLTDAKRGTIDRFVKDGFLCIEDGRLFLSRGAYFVMNSVIGELI